DLTLLYLTPLTPATTGQMQMQERVNYGGWPNCVRLTNGRAELIVTTDVGPRVIRFGFVGGQNLFKEFIDQMGKTGGSEWRSYGGHPAWHPPGEKPPTFAPPKASGKNFLDGRKNKIQQQGETTQRKKKKNRKHPDAKQKK